MSKVYEFEATIHPVPDKGGAYVIFPYDIREEFGKGRVKVHATFDEHPYDGSIVNMGIVEVKLYTSSAGFNSNNGNIGGQFKRFGSDSHAGLSPHVHQPQRNVTPTGDIYGGVGSKTSNGGVTSPGSKDVKQLYDYLNNGKYRK